LLLGLALAAQVRLELNGRARLERKGSVEQIFERVGDNPLTLDLQPGDRLCVERGEARLTYGVRIYTLGAATACFQLADSPSLWQRLVEACKDVGICKDQAARAFAKRVTSRGDGDVPALYLPTDYSLAELHLPIANGRRLRLLRAGGEELFSQQVASGLFTLPTGALRFALRLEVSGPAGVVYAAPVVWVALEADGIPQRPREQGLRLMLSEHVGFAPAAYSYLLAAGERDLAAAIEAQIRKEFSGTSP
jgi:hypothetical protein